MGTVTKEEELKNIIEVEREMSAKELGDEIKRLRSTAGWTQKDLAKRIGLFQTGVSDMERGEHTFPLETVYRLATAFNINPFRLAAIYWGIELDNISNKDKELIDSMLKLLDDYRSDTGLASRDLPPLPVQRHPRTARMRAGMEDAKAIKRRSKTNKPAENNP